MVGRPGSASVTVVDPGPTILFTNETWSTPGDYSSLCTATASAYESWNPNAGITYQWIVNEGWGGEQRVGDDATCPNLLFDERLMGVAVIATDANGASTVQGFSTTVQSLPAEPTVSILETDTGGMIFEGDAANFDIHADAGTSGRPPLSRCFTIRWTAARLRRRIISRRMGRSR